MYDNDRCIVLYKQGNTAPQTGVLAEGRGFRRHCVQVTLYAPANQFSMPSAKLVGILRPLLIMDEILGQPFSQGVERPSLVHALDYKYHVCYELHFRTPFQCCQNGQSTRFERVGIIVRMFLA